MKLVRFAVAVLVCAPIALAQAQSPQQPSSPPSGASVQNPVTSSARQIFERQQKNLIAAAEEMPADKYNFKPTEKQDTFGQMMAHIAGSNAFLCQRLGGATPPPSLRVKAEEGKDKIVAAVKASFDYCADTLKTLDDSKLGEEITMFRGNKAPRAAALFGLTNDFADHYAHAAEYLRISGLLPPTAQQRGE